MKTICPNCDVDAMFIANYTRTSIFNAPVTIHGQGDFEIDVSYETLDETTDNSPKEIDYYCKYCGESIDINEVEIVEEPEDNI